MDENTRQRTAAQLQPTKKNDKFRNLRSLSKNFVQTLLILSFPIALIAIATAGPNGPASNTSPRSVHPNAPQTQTLPSFSVAAVAAATTPTETAGATPGIACTGTGTDGKRIQAVYARVGSQTNRYGQVVPTINKAAAFAENVFKQSAAQSGGVRHLRWVTKPGCVLDVLNISVPNIQMNSFIQAGLTRTDRVYAIWTDEINPTWSHPGVTYFRTPGVPSLPAWSLNFNTGNDGSWFPAGGTMTHEIMHGLGGVYGTPNSTGLGHCTDENDLMCNIDAAATPRMVCNDQRSEMSFDCNDDDYFAPIPKPGSWLASNPTKNIAFSPFLNTTGTVGQPNDFFMDAKRVTSNVTTTGSNVGATAEATELAHAGNAASKSLWYTWTATRTGSVTVKTFNATTASNFDTVLAVYKDSGNVNRFATNPSYLIVSNDNMNSTSLRSKVVFTATAGRSYQIAVDGKNGATGNVVLLVSPE